MSLRERLRMFVLTRQEQHTIAFVILIVVLGLATKHYRATHPATERPTASQSQQPSPKPRP